MTFSLLTYNLYFSHAREDFIRTILPAHKPDIVCLQEIATDDATLQKLETASYRLADFSNSFIKFGKIFGVATLYNSKTLNHIESNTFKLPRSYYELFLILLRGGNNPRTVLKTEFSDNINQKKLTIYNTHLSPLATNSLRAKQVEGVFQYASSHKSHESLIITGDLNYAYGRKRLESLLHEYSLKEATNTISYTFDGVKFYSNFIERIILKFLKKTKNDYIFYRNLKILETKRLDIQSSDHFPILTRFEFE